MATQATLRNVSLCVLLAVLAIAVPRSPAAERRSNSGSVSDGERTSGRPHPSQVTSDPERSQPAEPAWKKSLRNVFRWPPFGRREAEEAAEPSSPPSRNNGPSTSSLAYSQPRAPSQPSGPIASRAPVNTAQLPPRDAAPARSDDDLFQSPPSLVRHSRRPPPDPAPKPPEESAAFEPYAGSDAQVAAEQALAAQRFAPASPPGNAARAPSAPSGSADRETPRTSPILSRELKFSPPKLPHQPGRSAGEPATAAPARSKPAEPAPNRTTPKQELADPYQAITTPRSPGMPFTPLADATIPPQATVWVPKGDTAADSPAASTLERPLTTTPTARLPLPPPPQEADASPPVVANTFADPSATSASGDSRPSLYDSAMFRSPVPRTEPPSAPPPAEPLLEDRQEPPPPRTWLSTYHDLMQRAAGKNEPPAQPARVTRRVTSDDAARNSSGPR